MNERINLKSLLPLSCLEEYDSAAKWCAERGYKGKVGDPLPANMASEGALKWIQEDPESFEERVKEMAYMVAMNKTPLGLGGNMTWD